MRHRIVQLTFNTSFWLFLFIIPCPAQLLSLEELLHYAAVQSPIVIVNEAHDGEWASASTRRLGKDMLTTLDSLGFKVLAMEALNRNEAEWANSQRTLPPTDPRNYTAAAEMRSLMQKALDLGWSLEAYDMTVREAGQMMDAPEGANRTFAYTQRREAREAQNLWHIYNQHGQQKTLVWCGNGHGSLQPVSVDFFRPEGPSQRLKMMGQLLWELSGIKPFVIDQTVTVSWPDSGVRERGQEFLARYKSDLEAMGGTGGLLSVGILRDSKVHMVDAWILSTHHSKVQE